MRTVGLNENSICLHDNSIGLLENSRFTGEQ